MKKKKYGCLSVIAVFAGIFIVLAIIMNNGIKDMEKHPEKYDDSIAMKYISVTSEEGKKIDDVLISCGINGVSKFEHDELLDNAHTKGETGYRLECERAENVILYIKKNMQVHSLVYAGHKLYAKGKVKATIQDYTFSTDEATKYQILCEEQVKTVLKSPSTAKFPNILEWGFGKKKNAVTVQGYVDAQNSFGAETRSNFEFKINAKSNKITSFIFDGEKII